MTRSSCSNADVTRTALMGVSQWKDLTSPPPEDIGYIWQRTGFIASAQHCARTGVFLERAQDSSGRGHNTQPLKVLLIHCLSSYTHAHLASSLRLELEVSGPLKMGFYFDFPKSRSLWSIFNIVHQALKLAKDIRYFLGSVPDHSRG